MTRGQRKDFALSLNIEGIFNTLDLNTGVIEINDYDFTKAENMMLLSKNVKNIKVLV